MKPACAAVVAFAGTGAFAQSFYIDSQFGGVGSTDVQLVNRVTGQIAEFGPTFDTTRPGVPSTASSGGGSTGGGLGYIDAMGNAITVGDVWITAELSYTAARGGSAAELMIRVRGFATFNPEEWDWAGGSSEFTSFEIDGFNIFGFEAEEPLPFFEARSGSAVADDISLIPSQFGGGNLDNGLISPGLYSADFFASIRATAQYPTRSFDGTYRFIVPAPGSLAILGMGLGLASRRRR